MSPAEPTETGHPRSGSATGVPQRESARPTGDPRIGIFGGSFNPIHLGHLLLAETARETLALDRVVFIPTHLPPHKSSAGLLPGAARLELIQAAIQGHPAFVASDIELQRRGASYSIDTVRALRQQLPRAKLFLLVGQDMLSVKWKDWNELTRLCTVVAAARPGSRALGSARHFLATPRRGAPGSVSRERLRFKVKTLDMPQVDIASSDIRKRLQAGRSIRYLVPPVVHRLIRQRGFYGSPKEGGA